MTGCGRLIFSIQNMIKKVYFLAASLLSVVCASCDDDHRPSWSETAPFEVEIQSVSIADGALINASTESMQVVYGHDVVINTLVDITINGTKVPSARIEEGNKLEISLELIKGNSYVLNIPERAIAGVGSKTFAPAITLTFKTEGTNGIIDASQLTDNLTNPNASAEAKIIYNFLKDNYGKRQLSGAMGEVAWGTAFCDLIYNSTGKYPAVVGFDYIHLCFSPANWIDYGDITPVKNVWDAGSIPAMTWHWNVPKSKDDISMGYDAHSDVFNAANVLVEGTWENEVAEADVEKLAGYMAMLQDAGIPILWRPFHEAAGDYTWGSWFWWGNSGVKTTIDLWKWLRNKLENEYGINNLIWVWTVQTSDEGKMASMEKIRAAYPGDDVVDIVGADIYQDALTNATSIFEILYNLVGGKKIVALSECGNLLDVESAFADGALWSYFMGWYDMEGGQYGFNLWNKADEWKTVMNNPLVLDRGDFKF